ncbi:MAG: class I SAM-dependent methyltransferase [Rhodobacter sp.]|nr:class I SAM-dependent methyltransferase [Rhodobacter sp.]
MKRFHAALQAAEGDAIQSLDLSMFRVGDILNVALQRSETLADIAQAPDAIRAWVRGNDGPLLRICEQQGLTLVRRALGFIALEYGDLRPVLTRLKPRKLADIGCGYGFFDLFAHAEFGCDLVLVDTEESRERHFKFRRQGAAYSSLSTARKFLLANKCSADAVHAVNPLQQDVLDHKEIDLAVSFISCGFHYPCDMYLDFFKSSVVPGGSVILDIRKRLSHEILPGLAGLGKLTKIGETPDGKAQRMQLVTTPAPSQQAA